MTPKRHFETELVFDGDDNCDKYGAVVPPIYQNSLFTFQTWEEIEHAFTDKANSVIYSRGNNPTVTFVEKKLAQLARGEKAKLFGSGMAAVSAGILHFMSQGDHMITIKNTYGPTLSFINSFMKPKMGTEVSYVSGDNVEEFRQAIQPNTKLIYLESPSSVVFSLQDIEAIVDLAKAHNIATIVDNSWATPIYQKPLTFGVDLEVHSCSKYLGGHSDIVAGVLIGSTEILEQIHLKEYELLGGKLASVEANLLLRSLRTLSLRMQRHSDSAGKIARYLQQHPKIKTVFYPGLDDFKQATLARKQMTGFSGLLSFQLATENIAEIKRFFNALALFQRGVSWGGHESLIYAPAISCYKEQPIEQLKLMGISLGDMRISVGLEDPQDLIDDLSNALSSVQ
ncbi:PLP-dependent aspartate aminotransferase family protein [Thalassotalea sp. 1_MG-2023]|uniref:trans-sulfuration enzyme family protein n=1 Tax=Thalassotalea sp. 1_MG-2023 TaxID=3062680 RepID=UPI0026E2BA57|nr:PLP-dependent aspartate aminotransferase family protein [Thalassotalea sp. 1_MG-2023]MDO6426100.1 PLP-dependent aspartate aminotransferase family protein [Thalassotalea sp. 1_MG-2023]